MDTKRLTCAQTAKLVRNVLKAAYPGVAFSVRSHTYAGGASLTVQWTDGPSVESVHRTTDRYRGSDFDGRDDSKRYRDDTLLALPGGEVEQVSFGVDFINGSRRLSPGYAAQLAATAAEFLGEALGEDRWYRELETPYGTWGGGAGSGLLRWLGERVPPATVAP